MEWLWIIIIGLVVGAVAKLLMPGRDPGGFIITILLGIVGSIVGGWIGGAIGITPTSGWGQFVLAVIGAIILLIIYRMVVGRRAA